MGCQTAIVKQIVAQDGEYVIGLKGNQGMLHREVEESFVYAQATRFAGIAHDYHTSVEKGHGRLENREYWLITDAEYLAYLNEKNAWPNLRSIGRVKSQRQLESKTIEETRYSISSLTDTAQTFGNAVCSHWGIENKVHWVLDIAFQEDASRMRKDHSPANFATLRHMALNLLKHEHTAHCGTKAKRLKAGWSEEYLCKVLAG